MFVIISDDTSPRIPAYCLQTGECPVSALKIPKKVKLVVIVLWSWSGGSPL